MVKMVNFMSCVFYQNFLKIRMGASGTEQAMKGLPESGRQSIKGSDRNPSAESVLGSRSILKTKELT